MHKRPRAPRALSGSRGLCRRSAAGLRGAIGSSRRCRATSRPRVQPKPNQRMATTTTTPFEPCVESCAIPSITAFSSPGYVDPIRVVAKQALLPLLIIPDHRAALAVPGRSWRSHGDGGNMAVLTQKSEAIIRGARMLSTALGPAIAGFLEDPAIVEVMLNPDGRLWIDRLSEGLSDTGERLNAADGERIVRLVA